MSAVLDVNNERTKIAIRVPYSMKDIAASVTGARWDKAMGLWIAPIGSIKEVHKRIPHTVKRSHRFDSAWLAHMEREAEQVAEDFLDVPVTVHTPWRHQQKVYTWIRKRFEQHSAPYGNIDMFMGTGKTKVTIDVIQNSPDINRVLIVCPPSIIDVWMHELDKHYDSRAHGATIVPLNQIGTVQRHDRLKRALQFQREDYRLIVIVNYEGVWRGALGDLIARTKWDLVVCDESHKIKSHNGKASRFMGGAHKWAARRLTLSGTPMTNGPLDIFGQFRFLDPNILGTGWTRFKAKYAILGGYLNKQVKGYQHTDELRDIYQSHSIQVGRDVLDLPEAVHTTVPVTLEPSARRIYDELRDEFVVGVREGVITASNALVSLLRLQQITGGSVTDDDGHTSIVSTAKRDTLAELLEGIDPSDPVVVFGRFTADIDAIEHAAQAAGRSVARLTGDTKQLAEWKAGEYNVLAANVATGSEGIDLTRARYCIFYSLGFSNGDYVQALSRTHRPGQTRTVQYLHLAAKGTVDVKVYSALRRKANVIASIVESES